MGTGGTAIGWIYVVRRVPRGTTDRQRLQHLEGPSLDRCGKSLEQSVIKFHGFSTSRAVRFRIRSHSAVRIVTKAVVRNARFIRHLMVLPGRIELTTSPLPRGCSTTELRQRAAGEIDRNRRAILCHKESAGARTALHRRKASGGGVAFSRLSSRPSAPSRAHSGPRGV